MDSVVLLDTKLFFYINHGYKSDFLDTVMVTLSSNIFWGLIFLLFVLYSVVRKNKKMQKLLFATAITLGCVDLFTYRVLKLNIERPRPCITYKGEVHLLQRYCSGYAGFPSNHASNSMAVAVFLLLALKKKVARYGILTSVLVGYSRVYIGVHYPFDVLAGFLVGGLLGAAIYYIFSRFAPSFTFPEE